MSTCLNKVREIRAGNFRAYYRLDAEDEWNIVRNRSGDPIDYVDYDYAQVAAAEAYDKARQRTAEQEIDVNVSIKFF